MFDVVKCERCYHLWTAIAMFNTKGKECPQCGHYDPDFTWMELTLYKGEGALLTPIGQEYDIVTKN